MTSSSDAAARAAQQLSLLVCFYQERKYFLCERFSVAEMEIFNRSPANMIYPEFCWYVPRRSSHELVGWEEEQQTRLMPWHFMNSTQLVPEGWGVQVWQHQMIGSFSQAAANLYMCQHDGGILVSLTLVATSLSRHLSKNLPLYWAFSSLPTMPKARKSLAECLVETFLHLAPCNPYSASHLNLEQSVLTLSQLSSVRNNEF